MKIALYIAHEGLMRMLFDLWEDHDVRICEKWEGADRLKPKVMKGDEDIIVSTMPHHELNWLNTDKPVIAYMTDPIYPTAREGFKFWQKKENFITIGAEDCYLPEMIEPVSDYIPYAMTKYPTYNGTTNKVLIVNRKADKRLMEVTRAALYGHDLPEGKVYDVAQMMGNLPYAVANIINPTLFKQMYANYKVLFYFSNSPYTAVMYEAMYVGIPVVAYDFTLGGLNSVIEKYFPKRSIFPDEIRKMLQEELDKPAQKVIYPFPSFEEIKAKWNDLFERRLNA